MHSLYPTLTEFFLTHSSMHISQLPTRLLSSIGHNTRPVHLIIKVELNLSRTLYRDRQSPCSSLTRPNIKVSCEMTSVHTLHMTHNCTSQLSQYKTNKKQEDRNISGTPGTVARAVWRPRPQTCTFSDPPSPSGPMVYWSGQPEIVWPLFCMVTL